MIENEPLVVRSRYRLYTNQKQRDRLDAVGASPPQTDSRYSESTSSTRDGEYGQGTDVRVALMVVDRGPDWGTYSEYVTFQATLGYYGEFTIPSEVREHLSSELGVGDDVRVTIQAA